MLAKNCLADAQHYTYVDKGKRRVVSQSPAIQAVTKQETLPAIRALRAQPEMSDRLSGARVAGKMDTLKKMEIKV